MKTLTLVCNFVLLGLVGVEILTSDFPRESGSFIFVIAIAGIILNILMISGSSMVEIKPSGGFISNAKQIRWSFYLFLKIFAITLNSILLVLALIDSRGGSGYLLPYLFALIIPTFLLSIVRISLSKWNSFTGLKRTIFLTGTILVLLVTGIFVTFRIMIGNGIKINISIAKKEYPGKAEDALLAYLADSTKSPHERTEIAVWTLGQIRSRKALPVLKSLYKNNKGKTFSQYEIHKAIVSIESNWMGSKEKNVFGSWTRLNK